MKSQCVSTENNDSTKQDRGVKSDSEEEESNGHGLERSSSPQNSSSECIPFAEEGNLTIKQRPKAPGPPRAEAVLEPPDKPAAKNLEVLEFNLKESDTVKRRHKPKDKEQGGGSPSREGAGATEPESDSSRPPSLNPEVSLRISETSVERPASPATGSPIKPPLSPKPAVAPKPVRHSLLASQGLSSPTVTISVVQSLAFASPSSPTRGPPAPAPSAQAPQSPSLAAGRSHIYALGPGLPPEPSVGVEVAQQRLDQTSTSLAAALKDVERKLNVENSSDSGPNQVRSAGTILDDIGNMFDDLADQLDAMLD